MTRKVVTDEVKWKIVGAMQMGQRQNVIAKRLSVSQSCVSKVWKLFRLTGRVRAPKNGGRPRLLSIRDLNFLRRQVRVNPNITIRQLANEFNQRFGTNISRMTVCRRLHDIGLNSYSATRKNFFKKSDKMYRLKWCKQRRFWYERWRYVVFSDEANFELKNRKSRGRVWCHSHERLDSRFVCRRILGGGGSVGIWGCITSSGTGVCRIYDGRLDQNRYIDILENCLKPSIDLHFNENSPVCFQQDNAPCHRAAKVIEYLEENDIQRLPWPARSPDLNPIENVWNWIDVQLAKTNLNSIEELKAALHEAWLQVPVEMCENLIDSMTDRCNACIKAKGSHIKY